MPRAVRRIARKLEEAGHETWAVGGAVRDELLGRPTEDWDLATAARPEEVRRVFRRTVPLGIEHGTVGVLARDGTLYEVTTFRKDVETDGRHAVVTFAATIEEDLARRDFTFNALAWHPFREVLLDPFGGMEDLRTHVLRTVGRADERFREDFLRILRALRFASLFELDIEEATWSSLCALTDHLRSLSAERIREELVKILAADPRPVRALELYARSGALRVLYPELEALRTTGADASRHPWLLCTRTVEELPVGRPMLRLAALMRELEPTATASLLTRLRFSNAVVDETARRAEAPPLPMADADERSFRRWLSAVGPGRLPALARMELARARAESALGHPDRVIRVVESWRSARRVQAVRPPLTIGDLDIDGRGLIALGLKPGPDFGRILGALLDWVLDDPARNRRELLSARAAELAAGRLVDG